MQRTVVIPVGAFGGGTPFQEFTVVVDRDGTRVRHFLQWLNADGTHAKTTRELITGHVTHMVLRYILELDAVSAGDTVAPLSIGAL